MTFKQLADDYGITEEQLFIDIRENRLNLFNDADRDFHNYLLRAKKLYKQIDSGNMRISDANDHQKLVSDFLSLFHGVLASLDSFIDADKLPVRTSLRPPD